MSIGRKMDKQVVVHVNNGILLSDKENNAFESVLIRWMKLDPIIQSEVSHKKEHQNSMLMHINGIQKDGNNDPRCKTAKETQL